MGGDKRSVSTDALETLGTIIDEKAGRDAIHLAVEPAIAAQKLYPGQDVGFVEGGVGPCANPLGIVDPFLKAPVQQGERFWLVVYPRQITSLRHVWTHPAFPEAAAPRSTEDKAKSEMWLRNFCSTSDGPDYDTLIAVATLGESGESDYYKCYIEGDYLHVGGQYAHGDIPPELWDHVEIVTGQKMGKRPSFFSCSC